MTARECLDQQFNFQEVPDLLLLVAWGKNLTWAAQGWRQNSFFARRDTLVMGKAKDWDNFYEQETDMKWLGISLPPRAASTPAQPKFLLSNQPGINKTCSLGVPASAQELMPPPWAASPWQCLGFHQERSPFRAWKESSARFKHGNTEGNTGNIKMTKFLS